MRFGEFGGRYVPEILVNPLEELEMAYKELKDDEEFKKELDWKRNSQDNRAVRRECR